MTPEKQEALANEVREVLSGYRVNIHYDASRDSTQRLYAVWTNGPPGGPAKQLIEPVSHKEAQEAKSNLIVADLIEIIEREIGA